MAFDTMDEAKIRSENVHVHVHFNCENEGISRY